MRTLMLGSRTKQLTFWLMFWTWAFSTSSGRNSRRFFSCPGKISLALTLTRTLSERI